MADLCVRCAENPVNADRMTCDPCMDEIYHDKPWQDPRTATTPPARPAMVTDAPITEEMIEAGWKPLWEIVGTNASPEEYRKALPAIYLAMHQAAMNGDVVERVARAICRANCPKTMSSEAIECQVENGWHLWENEARAAIEAIGFASLMGSRI